jgi:hypothetical protein
VKDDKAGEEEERHERYGSKNAHGLRQKEIKEDYLVLPMIASLRGTVEKNRSGSSKPDLLH